VSSWASVEVAFSSAVAPPRSFVLFARCHRFRLRVLAVAEVWNDSAAYFLFDARVRIGFFARRR